MRAFFIALQFLTLIPTGIKGAPQQADRARAVLWFPVVGVVVGSWLTLIMMLPLPALIKAALGVLAWVWITGGLHLDGLADSADAWAAARGSDDVARRLEVMRDPACGPAAVVALVILLLLKFASLANLSEPIVLLLPPMLARSALSWLLLSSTPARASGMAASLAADLRQLARPAKAMGAIFAVLLSGGVALCFGCRGLLAFVCAVIVFCVLRKSMNNHLGGYTGDTCGALVEIIETSVLLALSSSASL